MLLPVPNLPEEARTSRKGRCAQDDRAPNHISKTVLSTVHLGPSSCRYRDRGSVPFRVGTVAPSGTSRVSGLLPLLERPAAAII